MEERDDWDRHWLAHSVAATYNPAQAFRRELVAHWLNEQSPGADSHLLDIGSGQGDLIASLVRLFSGIEIAGVEISSTGIEQSRAKAPTARFFQRDLQMTPASDDVLIGWASLAVCSEVLEHVDEPETVLANAARYLQPGSRVFITVPGGPISAFDRYIGHRRHFDEASLRQMITAAGLIPERVSGVGFPFFNLYRMAVIFREKTLIKDVYEETGPDLGWGVRAAMRAFSFVLKRKLNSSSNGWQMVAVARKAPGTDQASGPHAID
jgi:SAM-dependent methyltransferase